MILTGQRRAEIGDLAKSEVDRGKRQIELPPHRTKNHRPHVVPLNDEVLAALPAESETRELLFGAGAGGFGAWSKAKQELDARITAARTEAGIKKAMPAWTLHDLRRSFATHISERGIAQPHVVEAILNHMSGAKVGVAGVYNRAAYLAEKRQALGARPLYVGGSLARGGLGEIWGQEAARSGLRRPRAWLPAASASRRTDSTSGPASAGCGRCRPSPIRRAPSPGPAAGTGGSRGPA